MKTTETTRIKSRVQIRTNAEDVHEPIATGALASIYFVGIFVGLWSLASLIGGLVFSGGPIGLVQGYFQAVTGL